MTKRETKPERIAKAREGNKLLPHEILLSVARGEAQTRLQFNPTTGRAHEFVIYPTLGESVDAAYKAAPYYAPKLAQIQHRLPSNDDLDKLSDADLLRIMSAEQSRGDGED